MTTHQCVKNDFFVCKHDHSKLPKTSIECNLCSLGKKSVSVNKILLLFKSYM